MPRGSAALMGLAATTEVTEVAVGLELTAFVVAAMVRPERAARLNQRLPRCRHYAHPRAAARCAPHMR